MNWVLGLSILLIMIYLVNHQLKRKKHRALKKQLKNNWGKIKEEEYHNFEIIDQYFRNSINKEKAFHIISDQTNDDLDIHDLFEYLDRTTSKIGQQYLYYKLRVVERKNKLLKFDSLTQRMESDANLRLDCQLALSTLSHYSAYDLEKLINDEVVNKPPYHKFLVPLSITSLITLFLGFFNPIFFLVLLPLFMVNIIFHYKTKTYISYYLRAVSQLNISLIASEKIASYSGIMDQFPDLTFIPEIKKIWLKTKFISFENQLNNELAVAVWFLFEIVKIQFNFEAIIFYSFINDIAKRRKSIDSLFQFLGEIDCAISIASVKHQNDLLCKPTLVENKDVNISGIIHPLIKNCVSNDLSLSNKSLLLTGSNMSGKTTFIRAIAISSITAQTLNIAFAKEFSTPFFKVYSSIRITDNLGEDTSYYLKEVLTIKKLIEVSNEPSPCLFILDEIFKGTNTIERISGGKAILSYLNKEKDFVFVSTHDIELANILKNKNFDLHHFTEQVSNNKLFFDHKLKKGKLKTRNAIKILELYDYPKEIIADAKETEKENFG